MDVSIPSELATAEQSLVHCLAVTLYLNNEGFLHWQVYISKFTDEVYVFSGQVAIHCPSSCKDVE